MKKYLILILVLGVWAVWALFGARFIPSHDGEYHIIRFANFFTMLSQGYWFPRWAPDLNSGYGVPLFNFHYPFPNYIGSLFHAFGTSFVDAVKLTLAAGYLAAAVASFCWLKRLVSPRAAVLGTIAGMFVPYWFVDLYVRGSVGEVWAIAFLFVVLGAIERKRPWAVGIGTALLIISHNILALLFVPFLLLYMLLRWPRGIGAWALGILTAAYFWLPALAERSFMQGLNSTTYSDHFPELVQILFPSWGTGFSGPGFAPGEMSFQWGVMPLMAFVLALLVLRKQKDAFSHLVRGFAWLAVLIFFFMLPASRPVWESVPFIQYLQYPWRLLSFVIPLTALLAAFVAERKRKIGLIVVIVGLIAVQGYTRPVTYEPRHDAHYLSRREFTDGTSSLGNSFTTIWAPWKNERPQGKLEITEGSASVVPETERPLEYRFHVAAEEQSVVRLNVLYYPGWTATIDGQKMPVLYGSALASESAGVIQLAVPAGDHDIQVWFAETPLRQWANIMSFLGLFCLSGWAILKRRHEHRTGYNTSAKRTQRPRRGRLHKAAS